MEGWGVNLSLLSSSMASFLKFVLHAGAVIRQLKYLALVKVFSCTAVQADVAEGTNVRNSYAATLLASLLPSFILYTTFIIQLLISSFLPWGGVAGREKDC